MKSTVFAFASDLGLVGKSEIERYFEIIDGEEPFISVICVVGRGYWYIKDGTWQEWNTLYPLHEVIGFLSGIHNTYRKIIKERGTPLLGHYLLD